MSAKMSKAMGGSLIQVEATQPHYRSQADAMDGAPQKVEDREDHPSRSQRFPGQDVTAPYVGQNVSSLGWFTAQVRSHCSFQYRSQADAMADALRKVESSKAYLAEASDLLIVINCSGLNSGATSP